MQKEGEIKIGIVGIGFVERGLSYRFNLPW